MSLCSNCKMLTNPRKEKSYVKLNYRNSAVCIVTRLRAGRSMVPIPVGARYFSLFQNVWTDSRSQLATYPMGKGDISLGKAAGVKVKLSRSAKIKNSWSYTSNPPTCNHGVERDNFTCTHFIIQTVLKVSHNAISNVNRNYICRIFKL